jgi:hypothetical protein
LQLAVRHDEAKYLYVAKLWLTIVLAEKVMLYVMVSLAHILGGHPGVYLQGYGSEMISMSSYAGGTLWLV